MAAAEANEVMEEEQSMGELFAANNEYQLAEQLLPPPVPLDQAQALSGLFADADGTSMCHTHLGSLCLPHAFCLSSCLPATHTETICVCANGDGPWLYAA